ncbi:NusG domain II-containing protein [Alkaliphilus hydrothermalis]|uniref:NusG domain-containing protein n=1 Tax=Alkaliphilus hydrothermalis TaxID=1482730 RepID=A0ABS2NQG6_9FIRM|nr:NusG domain II-containing protein [Alkaliphilus hydrothermalis]MBM7615132.1 hypothetical protein [Alkaliphilus hydrothermalis]
MKFMKLMTTADKILILFIIVLSISSIFAIPLLLPEGTGDKEVVVNLDGKAIHRFPLVDSQIPEIIDFDFKFNNKNYTGRLEMKDGQVRLHRLSEEISPLSIHADMGWISEPHQMIVSLPVKMVITIESAEEAPFDAISY